MREFKFRQWVEEFQEYITWERALSIENPVNYLNDEGVEQFTGLKDCNGVEIYEGDILKDVSPTAFQANVGYVKYYPEFGYCIMTKANGMWHSYRQEYWKYSNQMSYEVVGNIHENPELIEVVDHA